MTFRRRIAGMVAVVMMLSMASLFAEELSFLTFEEAKVIALSHAELSEEDVFWTKLGHDEEDGRQVFELEFIFGDKEYEFDLDLYTGEILKVSIEALDRRKSAADFSTYLSMDEAVEIALLRAEVAAQQAVFTKIEFDFEDGQAEYGLEFYTEDQRYDIELDARTGDILSYKVISGNKNK